MLWFSDSLLFSSFSQYQTVTGISGASSGSISWAAEHPSGRRSALRTGRGLGLTAVQPPPASEFIATVYFGCWVRFSNAGSATETLCYTRDVSLNQQILVEAVSTSTGVSLVFSGRKVLLVTPELAKDEWHFIEAKIFHDTTDGEIEVRVGGGRLAAARGLRTDLYALVGSPVHGLVWPEAASTFINDFADFYICDELADGSLFRGFLGPIEYQPVVAESDDSVEWDYSPESGRLLILAGQSNMAGKATSSKPTATSKVRYWDEYAGAVGQLIPGTNSSGMLAIPPTSLGYWGPEVRICERIDAATPGGHTTYLVKATKDTSTPFPLNIPGYSWFKDFTHDLTDRSGLPTDNCLVNYVRNLVAAELGGNWDLLTDITFVWYQGETDAVDEALAPFWSYYFGSLMEYLRAELRPGVPMDIKLILVRIHQDTAFDFTSTVYQQQSLYDADAILSVDDLTLTDGYHLDETGYNTVGDRIFEAWMRLGRPAAELLNDFQAPGRVGEGIDSGGGETAVFTHSGAAAVRPMLRMVRKSAYDTAFSATLRADLSEIPQDPLTTPGTVTAARDSLDVVEVPEKVASSKIQVTLE